MSIDLAASRKIFQATFDRWGLPLPEITSDAEAALNPGNPDVNPLAAGPLSSLLTQNPSLSLDQLKRFPEALEGTHDFLPYALKMLSEPYPSNNTLTYFIDKGGSSPFFDENVREYREVLGLDQNLTLEQSNYEEYIRKTMAEFEVVSGGTLNLKEVESDEEAFISIYRNPQIGSLLGLSIGVTNGSQKWRNVFYGESSGKGSDERDDQDTLATIRHEIGHALGLIHPTDLSTYDYIEKNLPGRDPDLQKGANTAYDMYDTVMSYNSPTEGDIPYVFSVNDSLAMLNMWSNFQGSEDFTEGYKLRKFNLFESPDKLINVSINDNLQYAPILDNEDSNTVGDEFFQLTDGDDEFVYRGGFDFVEGGQGSDLFIIAPETEVGYLTITDFQQGEDSMTFSGSVVEAFAIGGATLVLSSDTDQVVIVEGSYSLSDLTLSA